MSRFASLFRQFRSDESGFILTAELVLISSLLVIGLVVGLSSVQTALVGELNDVGTAIGSLNQSYYYSGMQARKTTGVLSNSCGLKSYTAGSAFYDTADECDADADVACSAFNDLTTEPLPEGGRTKTSESPAVILEPETAEALPSPRDA